MQLSKGQEKYRYILESWNKQDAVEAEDRKGPCHTLILFLYVLGIQDT